MDDIVEQAMRKWPQVPHCYGWLGLDARGNWYMRDQQAQDAGAFASGRPGAKGSRVEHAGLIAFIQRNYACDPLGQWYFQNGPQRVYVELEATPWVWRLSEDGAIHAHDGKPATYVSAVVDAHGRLYLQTTVGFGVVHTQDMVYAAQAIETRGWVVAQAEGTSLEQQFGFISSPLGACTQASASAVTS